MQPPGMLIQIPTNQTIDVEVFVGIIRRNYATCTNNSVTLIGLQQWINATVTNVNRRPTIGD